MPLIATAMHYIRRTSTVLRQVLGRAAAQPMRASTAGLVVLSILQLQPSPATAQRQDDGGYQQAVGVSCPQDGVNNRPDGLSYIACNCTSFAAWKLKQAGVPERDFSGLEHAKDWGKAIDRGSARNGHGKPRAGAIAVSSEGEYGHVLWVVESLEGGESSGSRTTMGTAGTCTGKVRGTVTGLRSSTSATSAATTEISRISHAHRRVWRSRTSSAPRPRSTGRVRMVCTIGASTGRATTGPPMAVMSGYVAETPR